MSAWLQCIPSGPLEEQGLTRSQLMGAEQTKWHTPPPGPLHYLYDALTRVGLCQSTMGGFLPTSWVEFMHWPPSRRLLECELETMRRLSEIYAYTRNNGSDMPQPWEPPQ